MADRTNETIGGATVAATGTLAALEPIEAAGAGLILAFADQGRRGPERLLLPTDGITLGRGVNAFAGGALLDDRLSRRHAEVVPDGKGGWIVRDLGSRNGTFVRDRKVGDEGAHLSQGDVLRLGNTLLVFRSLATDAAQPDQVLPGLVGSSDAMARVGGTVRAVAPHASSVLITGATGTGKEVVARAIHALSGRRGSFVAMNCGAVAEGLLASELFGHRKGAFTGASEARPGLFRSADGGTLFLDEVGEMPAELQVQLLRVLESRTVKPVGGSKEHPVDVRVLAATHRDLLAEVRAGRFRSDLFARLHQWPVSLPTLRDRPEDVPLLVRHLAARNDAAHVELDADLVEALMLHPWPLNVRGLLNVVTVALIGRGDGPLAFTPEVRQLLDADRALVAQEPAPEPPALTDPSGLGQTQPLLRRVAPPPEPEALREALTASSGSVAAAARQLGCSRQQVYRLLDQMGWTLDEFRS